MNMKNKIVICSILSIVLLFTGCSNGNNISSSEFKKLQKQVDELQKENADLKSQLNSKSNNDLANTDSTTDNNTIKEIKIGQTITEKDYCQFTINKIEFAKVVKPPHPEEIYNYYSIKDKDNIYLHIAASIKNLQGTGMESDNFANVAVTYDNKYNYEGLTTIEEAGGTNFTYTNITDIDPLKIGKLHYLLEVPVQVKNDKKPLVMTVTIDGNAYRCKIR